MEFTSVEIIGNKTYITQMGTTNQPSPHSKIRRGLWSDDEEGDAALGVGGGHDGEEGGDSKEEEARACGAQGRRAPRSGAACGRMTRRVMRCSGSEADTMVRRAATARRRRRWRAALGVLVGEESHSSF
ncbi:hypothetical protein GUJ93_ZPchr0002g25262 [Zizania palustris]|uniref:Uncharacterized protein n=1 Tax=Zizania palustris TaxID=103762 RepID=A0A8J5RSG8_ZIZPA|nr:hypothetical protein GUJ93_ZPchr0002g25262 [Zizania palustris]